MIQDRQSSVASTKKTMVSAVNTLSSFTEKGSVPLYNYIFIVFVVVMTFFLIGNMVVYLYPSLEWNNSVEPENSIVEYISLFNVVYIGMRSEINILNTKSYYRDLGSLNTTFITTLITQPDYPS